MGSGLRLVFGCGSWIFLGWRVELRICLTRELVFGEIMIRWEYETEDFGISWGGFDYGGVCWCDGGDDGVSVGDGSVGWGVRIIAQKVYFGIW